jgi:hypothetical protein
MSTPSKGRRKADRFRRARSTPHACDLPDYYVEYSTIEEPRIASETLREDPPPARPDTYSLAVIAIAAVVSLGIAALIAAGAGDFFQFLSRSRAAVRLETDFPSGLNEWVPLNRQGLSDGGDWQCRNGFVRPGTLRIWKPSMGLTDYRLEFAGWVERRGMSWTYRTVDAGNYYSGRLVVTKRKPLPEVMFVRSARVNGKDVREFVTRVPLAVDGTSAYKVAVTVEGPQISTAVNGVIVDSWTDERFASGGVGFQADRGEQMLLRSVRVTRLDNALGRLIAQFGFINSLRGR